MHFHPTSQQYCGLSYQHFTACHLPQKSIQTESKMYYACTAKRIVSSLSLQRGTESYIRRVTHWSDDTLCVPASEIKYSTEKLMQRAEL